MRGEVERREMQEECRGTTAPPPKNSGISPVRIYPPPPLPKSLSMKRALPFLHTLLFCALAMLASARAAPSIGNLVWSDLNDNGTQNAGEPGIAGVTVQLWNGAKNDLITTTTTDANGAYALVAPGPGSYRIRVLLPQQSYRFSPMDASGNASTDSDINPAGNDFGFTDILTYDTSVVAVANVDAGIHIPLPLPVGDLVWSDLNYNGIRDAGEQGLPDVTVQLWNAAKNSLITTTTTNAGGNYTVSAPSPGNYRVRILLPQDASGFSPKDVAAAGESSDSDINPSGNDYGFTDAITLSAGAPPLTNVDAGIYFSQPARIGNFVWSDDDADGGQDAGEPGIAGVSVQLWNAAKNQLIATTVTNAAGEYALTAPQPGSYRVRVLLPAPAADRFTVQDSAIATNFADSDIHLSGSDYGFTDAFDILPGTLTLNTMDAGLLLESVPGHTIGNRIFRADASGLQPASGDILSVLSMVELLDATGVVLQKAAPRRLGGVEGYYGFTAAPGTYRLRFTSLDSDYIPTPYANAGSDDSVDSDIDSGGYTDLFTIVAGTSRRDLDAGFVRLVRIGNFVWHDQDGDGIQDAAEPGVPGVALELWDAAKTRRWDSTSTDTAGNYNLRAPGPGSYRIWALRPLPGDTFSPANVGSSSTDSDILSTVTDFGFSDPLTISPTTISISTQDAGLIFSTIGRQITPLRITAFSRTPPRLTFSGPAGGTYQLERSDRTSSGWSNVNAPVVTTTSTGSFTLTAAEMALSELFWRVRRIR